jgi:hypothetical protein
MVSKERKRFGRTNAVLTGRRKGDRQKVKLARRFRGETTMSLARIAESMRMGSWNRVSNAPRRTEA